MTKNFPTPIHEKVALCEQGELANAICKLPSCWVILADTQVLSGYCIILSNPVAGSLNQMKESQRLAYLSDMALVGDAILQVTGAQRINYETWANKDPALHTHIVPRFANEPTDLRVQPACKAYDFAKERQFDFARDGELISKLRAAIEALDLTRVK